MIESVYAKEPRQVEPGSARDLAHRLCLLLTVRVELELAGVPIVGADLRSRRDHAGDAEMSSQRSHDLLGRTRHDVQAPPGGLVLGEQVKGLLVDIWVDHVEHHVLHEPLDLAAVPALRQLQHALLETLHPLFVGTDQQIHELRVRTAHELSARHHAGPIEGSPEGERRRPADDRLVEVEEGRFHATYRRPHRGRARECAPADTCVVPNPE